jgi:hypothetical protein
LDEEAGCDDEWIADLIERSVRERDAGFGFSADTISPLEAELILIWDSTTEAYERAHQSRVSSLFELLLARE